MIGIEVKMVVKQKQEDGQDGQPQMHRKVEEEVGKKEGGVEIEQQKIVKSAVQDVHPQHRKKNKAKTTETYSITGHLTINPDLPHGECDSLCQVNQIVVYSHLVCKEFFLQGPTLVEV